MAYIYHMLLLIDCNLHVMILSAFHKYSYSICILPLYAFMHSMAKILLLTSYNEPILFWRLMHAILISCPSIFGVIVRAASLEYISEVRCTWNTFIFYIGSSWKLFTEIFMNYYMSPAFSFSWMWCTNFFTKSVTIAWVFVILYLFIY